MVMRQQTTWAVDDPQTVVIDGNKELETAVRSLCQAVVIAVSVVDEKAMQWLRATGELCLFQAGVEVSRIDDPLVPASELVSTWQSPDIIRRQEKAAAAFRRMMTAVGDYYGLAIASGTVNGHESYRPKRNRNVALVNRRKPVLDTMLTATEAFVRSLEFLARELCPNEE